MTNVDVLYRYAGQPRETAVVALTRLREVYGIRMVTVDEGAQTIRVEYDATRLAEPTVRQLVRRTGLDLLEEIALSKTPPPPALEESTAAAK